MAAARLPRALVALAIIGLLAVGLLMASPAASVPAPIHITGTDGQGVAIRPTPDTSQPALGRIPDGASPDYNCYVWGERIGTVPIWFNVNYGGVTGFYSSYYDDSTYSSDAELQAKYGVFPCGEAQPPPPPPPPETNVFTIMNADIGVFYRSSPNWDDTPRIVGVGVYNGDRVRVHCGAFGTAVGSYSNTAWSYVTNLSRNVGDGWVNGHFINDDAPANAWPATVPQCGPGTPGITSGPTAAPPTGTRPPPGCYHGIRWTERTLHFAYNGKHRYYGNAYQAAKNWTALGAGIKILPAGAGDKVDIVFADVNRKSLGYYASALLGTGVRDTHETNVRAHPRLPGTPGSPGVVGIAVNQVFMDKLDDPHKSYVLTHELGHALGLQHPSACGQSPRSVMREGTDDVPRRTVLRPQTYDILALKELYGR